MGIGNHHFWDWMELANPLPAALFHEVFQELWANVVVRIQETGPLDKNNNAQIQGGCYGSQNLCGISCSCLKADTPRNTCSRWCCFRDQVFVAFMGFLGRSSTGGECSTILLQVVLLLFEEIRLTSWYGFKYYIFTKFHTCLVVSRISSINSMILVPTTRSLSVFCAPPSCWFCESLHHTQLKKIC